MCDVTLSKAKVLLVPRVDDGIRGSGQFSHQGLQSEAGTFGCSSRGRDRHRADQLGL